MKFEFEATTIRAVADVAQRCQWAKGRRVRFRSGPSGSIVEATDGRAAISVVQPNGQTGGQGAGPIVVGESDLRRALPKRGPVVVAVEGNAAVVRAPRGGGQRLESAGDLPTFDECISPILHPSRRHVLVSARDLARLADAIGRATGDDLAPVWLSIGPNTGDVVALHIAEEKGGVVCGVLAPLDSWRGYEPPAREDAQRVVKALA